MLLRSLLIKKIVIADDFTYPSTKSPSLRAKRSEARQSIPEPQPQSKRLFLNTIRGNLTSLLCLLLLSACGFRPLLSESQPTTQALRSVQVSVIKDRAGQQLRNLLMDFMTPSGSAVAPRYRLDVTLNESSRELSFRKDLVARRQEMSLKARFTLIDLKTGKSVFQNHAESYSSFSLGPRSDFAAYSSYISEQDGRERMVKLLAHDIRLQVANFLLHHEEKEGAGA